MNQREDEPVCERCGNSLSDCGCRCPYCGETSACECCIGPDKATGR